MASKGSKTVALEQPVDIAQLRDIRWTAVEARQVLAAWKASGLSVSAFAKRHGLGEQRVSWWKKRLAAVDTPKPAFVPLVVASERSDGPAPLVVRLAPRPELEIRDPERVSPRWLATLLRELVEVSS